ncbi:hypothetical protein RFI_26904 [Reticulomyxa filosa]|uniref:Uncharacterized protein n=1 Tax=Reticulomyxa filosa TaxID=46433 RepID=X6MBQ3_RETFI|nr:hypothetical protein RFI_26904 [Reticulomyxa filosa]|eukprot:ETO10470.1 hypothetical protein RFI_26904 [Reticulomyxa filosa]
MSKVVSLVDDLLDWIEAPTPAAGNTSSNVGGFYDESDLGYIITNKELIARHLSKLSKKDKERKSASKAKEMLCSKSADKSIDCTFHNTDDSKTVYVTWIDYDGKLRDEWDELSAQSKLLMHTYETHPFVISHLCPSHSNFGESILGVFIAKTKEDYVAPAMTLEISGDTMTIKPGPLSIEKDDKQGESDSKKKKTRVSAMSDYVEKKLCGYTLWIERGLDQKFPSLYAVLRYDLAMFNDVLTKHNCQGALQVLQNTRIFINDNFVYYDYKTEAEADADAEMESNTNTERKELEPFQETENKTNEEKTEKEEVILESYVPPESCCFHPDGRWLKEHNNCVEKAECVEIYRFKQFVEERGYMPFVLLHELAHSYHFQIGFERKDVVQCFQHAVEQRLYRDIPFITGGIRKQAYALTDEKEYFAELTESYFGLNDFFPFVHDELKEYDPKGFDLLRHLWTMTTAEILDAQKQRVK